MFDDRNISQPTGNTSAIGDFPSYNYMSDITKRGEIFGMDSTTFFGGWYNTLAWSSDTRFLRPGGNATLGQLQSNVLGEHTNYGLRAREELKLTQSLTAVAGIGWETTTLKGLNSVYKDPVTGAPTFFTISADRAIPEHRARVRAALSAEYRVAVPRTRRYWLWNAASRKPFCPCQRSERQQHSASDAEEPRL